jgi:hypothetical protein
MDRYSLASSLNNFYLTLLLAKKQSTEHSPVAIMGGPEAATARKIVTKIIILQTAAKPTPAPKRVER